MKRVLFTSYDGLTCNLGQSQIIPYLCGLSEKGFRFSVLSCEKKENFLLNREIVLTQLKKYNIEWHYVFYTKKPPVLSTIYDLFRMYLLGLRILGGKDFSLIHSRSLISALVGYRLKKKFRTRFIFDMRGFYADERVDGGLWNLSNPLYRLIFRFFKKEETELLSRADYIISLTENAKNRILSWKEIPNQPLPVQVIPCCADLRLFSPESIDPDLLLQLREKFGLSGEEFVLSYLGSTGTWYLLDDMLDFFKCLENNFTGAKFLFITPDPPALITVNAIQKGIQPQSLIISPALRKQVPTYLALSNWSIFFIKPVFSKSASSPTKQGEIMGMGIPHICNAGVGDVDQIVADTNSGYVLNNLTEQNYVTAIEILKNMEYDRNKIREGAAKYYSLEKGIEKYLQVYNICLSVQPGD